MHGTGGDNVTYHVVEALTSGNGLSLGNMSMAAILVMVKQVKPKVAMTTHAKVLEDHSDTYSHHLLTEEVYF